MVRTVAHLIKDILDEVSFIKKATKSHTLVTYAKDDLTRRAVERAFLTISEAVRGLPSEDTRIYADVPWREIKAMGNVLRHEYHKIANDLIWNTIGVNLPSLEKAIRRMGKRHNL